jgi:3-(3-hydroxy-phenyl)propionate hydroxylase
MSEELLAPWSSLTEIELIRHAVYIYHSRIATRWKTGRVILAGDAAHVMPPFGGQGMNSGVRDAGSLAWRLALVIRGRADPAILETYETERRPHVRHMIVMSVVFATILTTRNRLLAASRDFFFRTLRHVPKIGRFFRRGDFKPMSTYPRGFIDGGRRRGRTTAAGTMIVQPAVTSGSGQRVRFDDMLGTEWSVVAMNADPRAVVDLDTAIMWEQLPARFIRVVPRGASRSDSGGSETVEDADGEFARWFAAHDANLAVVRPDKIVFGACDTRENEAARNLAQSLRAALNAPVERIPTGGRRLSTGVRVSVSDHGP